jgi:hypothetical protein
MPIKNPVLANKFVSKKSGKTFTLVTIIKELVVIISLFIIVEQKTVDSQTGDRAKSFVWATAIKENTHEEKIFYDEYKNIHRMCRRE